MSRIVVGLFAVALPACTISDDDPAFAGGGRCLDERYGDGTCDTSLDCAVPDIDCFHTFHSDDDAATWYGAFERTLAIESGQPARAIVAATDPRFAELRALLDRGWAAFRRHRPVGLLASQRPALVLVDDPSVNAFVVPDLDLQRAGFAVVVHTGLIAMAMSDDAMLGLMMHELQHAVGLHVLPEVKQRFTTFYVATDHGEPTGRDQRDDPRVHAAGTAWLAAAREVGALTNPELGGLPLAGDLSRILRSVLRRGLQANPSGCAYGRGLLAQVTADLAALTDPLSGALTPDASIEPRITAALASLRDDCLAGVTTSFVEVAASIAGATPAQVAATLTSEDRALIAGHHVVDAVALLGANRRARMRAIEAALATELGRPWSAVRSFSTEEDADDASVPVLRDAQLDPAGLGGFLGGFLPDGVRAACRAIIDAGDTPPYGVDLADEHHATCFRIYHIEAYASETAKQHARAGRPAAAHPRLLPPMFGELVMH